MHTLSLKKIDIPKYNSLKAGSTLYVETIGFMQIDGKTKIGALSTQKAVLISVSTKEKEIKQDGAWTGTYETLADTVVYNLTERPYPGYLYTVIGCGLFRLFELKQ